MGYGSQHPEGVGFKYLWSRGAPLWDPPQPSPIPRAPLRRTVPKEKMTWSNQEPVEAGAGRGRPDGVSSREVPDAARDAIKELIKG